jgi:hypothetical protein
MPSDRLDCAELACPKRKAGVPNDRRSRHPWRDLFEQLKPFAAQAVLEQDEASGISSRPCQGVDKAGTDWIDYPDENDRHGSSYLQQWRDRGGTTTEQHLR